MQQEDSNSSVNVAGSLETIPEADEVTTSRVDNGADSSAARADTMEGEMEVAKEQENINKVAEDNAVNEHEHGSEEEGGWSRVSPSKQGRSTTKKNEDPSIISSPSRFAILSDDQEESGNIQGEEGVHEEGEIEEDQLIVISSEDQTMMVKQKQEVVDGTRRTSTRHSKGLQKPEAENKSHGTSNLASAVGKKRTTKKY